MNETFYLSNILPQNYENNAGKATLFYLFDYVTRRSEKLGFQKKWSSGKKYTLRASEKLKFQ